MEEIVDFYGKEYPNSMTRDEFFFFLDSFFRGLYKTLVKADGTTAIKRKARKRLRAEEIKTIVDTIYGDQTHMNREEFIEFTSIFLDNF